MLGITLLVLAQISGIGEALYLWGAENQPFNSSIWEGFKTWGIMVLSGLVSLLVSIFFIA